MDDEDDVFEILPWMEKHFDKRQINEIEFCLLYASSFNHGIDGHNAKIILAKLAALLVQLHWELVGEKYPENIEPIMGYDLKVRTERENEL